MRFASLRIAGLPAVAALVTGTLSAHAQVINPVNGHYYEAITTSSFITWSSAKMAAQATTFQGMSGYLATLTSASENAFVANRFPIAVSNGYWLGGFQMPGSVEPDGGFTWVTGEPWQYTNWSSAQPNNNLIGTAFCGANLLLCRRRK